MVDFPSSLPCPTIDGFESVSDYGVRNTRFENGYSRQRRSTTKERTVMKLSFVLSAVDLYTFMTFANNQGYNWFLIDLPSHFVRDWPSGLVKHLVRFVGDIAYNSITADYVRLTASVELDLNFIPAAYIPPQPPVIPPSTTNLIIARTPSNPSPDWWVANTPTSPASDWTVAGTPNNPSN